MRCPGCNKVVSDIFPFCAYCGERLRQPISIKRYFTVATVLVALMLGYFAIPYLPDVPNLSSMTASTPTIAPTPTQKTFTNSIGMEFVQIPAGEFGIGSPSNEVGRYDNEGPVHQVKISKAFYMGKYEVTQRQWQDIMGNNPSYFKGDNLPVEMVSWADAQEFIKKLNDKEGTKKYRLPSEAEWEYAARAGTTTRYSFGDDSSMLGDYAWDDANSGGKSHDVGQKKPNPWGLYDMHGNVWEWVQDIYHGNYNGAPTDGSAWESGSGSAHVDRGGMWSGNLGCCRSANRYYDDNRSNNLGFRLVMEIATVTQTPKVTSSVSPAITPSASKAPPSPTPTFSDKNYSYLGGMTWYRSLDTGFEISQRDNKPIAVYFCATWSQYCEGFQTKTLGDTQVKKVLEEDYVLVAMDLDIDREVASKYGVNYPPYILFLDRNDRIINRVAGAVDANTFLPIVKQVREQVRGQ